MKKQIQLILNSTHDAMIAVDREGYITLFNKAASKLTHIQAKKQWKHIKKSLKHTVQSFRNG